ncbi:endo-1,4-beta-xylanase [Nocardia asteroides]|uniref:endo-1,4-beta-xylanase n=1 Tax=Nocardia asteroides TaxID=1824 RepID=UPI001E60C123|nr:endo-1,4-beta-xylanase [Nocardia asteroides]UGT54999.1 endo-1,4-beta-xylanase [Nocardia asteroides]
MSDDSENSDIIRVPMTVPTEELLRPIISNWFTNGVIDPSAFNISTTDRKLDNNRMSIARGSATTPEHAYQAKLGAIKERCELVGKPYNAPVGVLAVTVEEVESVEVKSPQGGVVRQPLTAWDDSMNENRPADHGHIDFSSVPADDKGACLLAAKQLLKLAMERDWKYLPSD